MFRPLQSILFCAVLVIISSLYTNYLYAQIYEAIPSSSSPIEASIEDINYHRYQVNLSQLRTAVKDAPQRGKTTAENATKIDLMLPNGLAKSVQVEAAPIASDKWMQRYPDIKTYDVRSWEGENVSGKICVTQRGLSGMIFTDNETFFIENLADGTHASYTMNAGFLENMSCEMSEVAEQVAADVPVSTAKRSSGSRIRVYATAIATTDQFNAKYGPGTAGINAKIAEHLTNLNTLYEREFSITFSLVAGNDVNITNNNGLSESNRTGSAHSVISANMTSNSIDYDIGHVFHWITGVTVGARTSGLAGLGVVCNDNRKAEGWSGGGAVSGQDALLDGFNGLFLGTLAHEIGHQFNAPHSYYGTARSCVERSIGNGYEPGSGNTVMSYEGTCNGIFNGSSCSVDHNIAPKVSKVYFHTASNQRILDYADNFTCEASNTATSNNLPNITSTTTTGQVIPRGTPFTLTGNASDGDGGDQLTYTWEEYDNDLLALSCPDGAPNDAAQSTTAPLFRSFDPVADGNTRHFPQLSDILGNTQTIGEILPEVSRSMNFRLTVRDTHAGGGGMDCEQITVAVDATKGPFKVLTGERPIGWTPGSTQTITWDVAGTNQTPINCSTVKISFSFDNGADNFSTVLVASTANDGSETITVPSTLTDFGKIKIECNENIFFNINQAIVAITNTCSPDGVNLLDASAVSGNAGDAVLNLALEAGGTVASPHAGVLNTSDPATNLIFDNNGNCGTFTNEASYEAIEIIPETTGSYTFTPTGSNSTNSYFGVFNSNFSPTSPCASYIKVNYDAANGANSNTPLTVSLTAGVKYLLVAYTFRTITQNFSATVSGAGNLFVPVQLNPGNDYTYVTVDNATGNIAKIDFGPDLRNINGGTYTVHGLAYIGGTNLSSYVGGAFSALQTALSNSTVCGDLSNNTKTVMISGQAPLAIDFVNLTATNTPNGILLNWETEGEDANAKFRVLRADDQQTFMNIGQTNAKNQALASYEWLDTKPITGRNYYKIELIESDGQVSYSNVVVASMAMDDVVAIYPNPIHTNQFYLNLPTNRAEQLTVQIHNSHGQLVSESVLTTEEGRNQYELNLANDVATGVYLVRLLGEAGVQQTLRLVKM